MDKSFKLDIAPDWHEIEPARNEISRFLKSLELSSDEIDALIMVIGELMENGIKYGYFKKEEDSKVTVSVSLESDNIIIDVIHPVDKTAYDHLEKLDKTIQWIRGYQDPFEAYTEKVKEVAKRSFSDQSSGLGLVRIAYEGRAILDFFLNENYMLNVSAVSSVEGGF